jgi:hypothetical protein
MSQNQKPPVEIIRYEYDILKYNLKVAQHNAVKAEIAISEAEIKAEEASLNVHKCMLEISGFEKEFDEQLKLLEEIEQPKEQSEEGEK